MTHHWVAQILDLLTLPPEVQAALDVAPERLPKGLTQKWIKGLARKNVS